MGLKDAPKASDNNSSQNADQKNKPEQTARIHFRELKDWDTGRMLWWGGKS